MTDFDTGDLGVKVYNAIAGRCKVIVCDPEFIDCKVLRYSFSVNDTHLDIEGYFESRLQVAIKELADSIAESDLVLVLRPTVTPEFCKLYRCGVPLMWGAYRPNDHTNIWTMNISIMLSRFSKEKL